MSGVVKGGPFGENIEVIVRESGALEGTDTLLWGPSSK